MEVVRWRERDRGLRVKAQVGGQTGGGRDSWIEEEDKISDSEWRNRWMIRQKEESWLSDRREAGCSFRSWKHRRMVRQGGETVRWRGNQGSQTEGDVKDR